MTPEKPHGGPYKELFVDVNAEALEKMKKQIEAEGKHAVLIPDELGETGEISEFTRLLNNRIKPEDIILYSDYRGKLKYRPEDNESTFDHGNSCEYHYKNDIFLVAIEHTRANKKNKEPGKSVISGWGRIRKI